MDKAQIITTIVQFLYLDSPAVEVESHKNLYRIGTVSSLTGLSVERLRAWERRYDLSPAHKSGKTRYYSQAQLERLRLIKHLIDLGQPISSLAPLGTQQLKARIEEQAPDAKRLEVVRKPTVGIAGPNLIMLENQVADDNQRRLNVAHRWANIDTLMNEGIIGDNPQILLVQMPVLSLQSIDFIKDNHPEIKLIAIYQFATDKQVSIFSQAGTPALRWPVSWAELEHVAISELGLSPRAQTVTPRQFSDEELIAIAATVEDETTCTQYLVEAIQQINAFALFAGDSAQAADRPMVYRRLQNDAGLARAQLESALQDLMRELTSE